MLSTKKMNAIIERFAVIWIVLTSGSMVFNICNMLLSMLILLGIALVFLMTRRVVSKRNLLSLCALCGFIAVSTLYNGMSTLVVNDLAILLIRLISLTIIMSNVDDRTFRKTYINLLYIIALISLPCFFIKLLFPNFTLPFTVYDVENNFYGTFYYTLGSVKKGVFNRNCGIFWESGLFQIYLNYALALLINSKDIKLENPIRKFIILSAAVLTTLSTMGYICYGIVIVMLLCQREKNKNTIYKKMIVFAGIALLILLFVESATHIIEGKLIDKGMSYGSRYDDTTISFRIALDNPIFGLGPANDHVTVFDNYMIEMNRNRLSAGNLSRSNGLGNFASKFGLVVTSVYLLLLYKTNKRMCSTTLFSSMLVLTMLICCLCNEPIMFTTLWLSFFFIWKHDSMVLAEEKNGILEERYNEM